MLLQLKYVGPSPAVSKAMSTISKATTTTTTMHLNFTLVGASWGALTYCQGKAGHAG